MTRLAKTLLLSSLMLSACASDRLSHDEARQKIAQIGRSNLVPDAIEIRRIISQTDTEAIAESSVTLAFQFKRANPNAQWQISAVRLGDRDWVSMDELLAAINAVLAEYWTTPSSVKSLIGEGWLLDTANTSSPSVLAE